MKFIFKGNIPIMRKRFSELIKGNEISEIQLKLKKNSQLYHKENSDQNEEILKQTNEKIFNKIFNFPNVNENNQNQSKNVTIFEEKDSIIQGGKNFTLNKHNIIHSGNNELINDLLQNNKLNFYDSRIQIQTLNMNDNSLLNDELNNQIYEVKLGNVTSIPKNEFTKNLQSTEEIIKENEYIYEMSLLGRKLENNEENKILNNYLSVDNKENHFVSTAIFQEESTKKFEENETPLSILLKNPLLMIIFFITGYILYPKLWKKEYFSKRSLERNNDNIYLSYRDNGETLYNYMNYRRGLYACVRSNFS